MEYTEMLEETKRLNQLPRRSPHPKDDVFYMVAPMDSRHLRDFEKKLYSEKNSIPLSDNLYQLKYKGEKVSIFEVNVHYKLGEIYSLNFKPYKN